jgi:O-acetyl-ADP-ribose deacetylase (regulator of RNase III)
MMSVVIASASLTEKTRLELVQGDLTQETVDAIVNAANSKLLHGGGVAGAITRAGGPAIQAESEEWVRQHGRVSHAEPAFTGPGRLPCRYVIHAVGPIWGMGDEDRKLSQAITGSLRLADQLKLATLAIPPISTGIFGFPKDRGAAIFLNTFQDYFTATTGSGLTLVRLTILDQPTLSVFQAIWTRWIDQGKMRLTLT